MFIHSVYFWLNEGLSADEREAFRHELEKIAAIESVRQSHIGIPADTDRPVIERGYSYALVLLFDDQQGHDFYQVHDAHERFRQECAHYWSRVLIFDSVE
ncbi:MAG: Dabb family protein [Blastocatellia bacterium]